MENTLKFFEGFCNSSNDHEAVLPSQHQMIVGCSEFLSKAKLGRFSQIFKAFLFLKHLQYPNLKDDV